MRILYAWKPYETLSYDYFLTATDGHFATFAYMARYYDVHLVVGGFVGTIQRDHYTIHGCGLDANKVAETIARLSPDALVCYGPCDVAEWGLYRAAAPSAFFCLDYAGGPLTDFTGAVLPILQNFDHLFVAHEVQARLLRSQGFKATKARGVPLNVYRPIPGIPKCWHLFCPTTFSPGKRPQLPAQYLEQYAPEKPSLFAGWMDSPAVVDMVRCGAIPLNKPEVSHRNAIQLGGRIPYALMPFTYNASAVCISGSQEEGGLWTVMESLACGTPAIVMSDCDWHVADAFRELAERGFAPAIQVVDPWPEAIHHAVEQAIATPNVERLARLAAVAEYDWWTQYERTDAVLKVGVRLKQAGQAVAS